MATYTSGIPNSTDIPSQSQGTIKDNFTSLDEQFTVDHSSLVSPGNGFHKKLTLPDQSASIPTSSSGQVVEYANKIGSVTMPYYQRDAHPTIFPCSPIKVAGAFSVPGGRIAGSEWNITSVTPVFASTSVFLTIVMTEPMRNANYSVIVTGSGYSTTGPIYIQGFASNASTFNIAVQIQSGSLATLQMNYIALEF